jgi:inhibitor of cysteine peptidase
VAAALLVIALAVIAVRGSGSGTSNVYPSEVQLADGDIGATVRIAEGGRLVIALSSNPSTGYRWLAVSPPDILLQEGEPRYVPPGSTSPVLGAPGTEVFTFRAEHQGTVQLMLDYRRQSEADPSAKTFQVVVEIK